MTLDILPIIFMKTCAEGVYAEVGYQDAGEAYYQEAVGPFSSPALGQADVEVGGVDEPGDQRPGFLWVPVPVCAPCLLCPECAGDYSEREHRESERDHFAAMIGLTAFGC